jgi:hypothetical protein
VEQERGEEEQTRPEQTRAGLRRATRPPMLSKKLISGLPAVCDWQLTVWEGGRRERPRPVRPLPLPLPLSPAKLSATDDKLSILLLWGTGDRGQGTGDREGAGLHMGQDKLPPSRALRLHSWNMDPQHQYFHTPTPTPSVLLKHNT